MNGDDGKPERRSRKKQCKRARDALARAQAAVHDDDDDTGHDLGVCTVGFGFLGVWFI